MSIIHNFTPWQSPGARFIIPRHRTTAETASRQDSAGSSEVTGTRSLTNDTAPPLPRVCRQRRKLRWAHSDQCGRVCKRISADLLKQIADLCPIDWCVTDLQSRTAKRRANAERLGTEGYA